MKFGLLACVLSIGQAVPQGDSIVDAARRQGGAVTLDIHINAGVGTVEELANLSSVLVADLEMPGLGGAEMVRQIGMIRPDLPRALRDRLHRPADGRASAVGRRSATEDERRAVRVASGCVTRRQLTRAFAWASSLESARRIARNRRSNHSRPSPCRASNASSTASVSALNRSGWRMAQPLSAYQTSAKSSSSKRSNRASGM